jgi:hypothetical protein
MMSHFRQNYQGKLKSGGHALLWLSAGNRGGGSLQSFSASAI